MLKIGNRWKNFKAEPVKDRFGPLTATELEAMASVAWDDGMLRVSVHVLRARAAEAAAKLAAAGRENLSNEQMRAWAGRLDACRMVEADLIALVDQGQRKMQGG